MLCVAWNDDANLVGIVVAGVARNWCRYYVATRPSSPSNAYIVLNECIETLFQCALVVSD